MAAHDRAAERFARRDAELEVAHELAFALEYESLFQRGEDRHDCL